MQKRFNQYYLTELIGSKPLRSVYLAHHVNDVSHKVLLKIFDATCLALGLESERFLSQVEWIKQLRHVHVLPILDLGVEQGQPYVVSEYLSGGTLRHRLDSLFPGHLSLQEALSIIGQVGQALSYFHERAHLHGNIKPENIFFNEQGEVLLADFRLSGFLDVAILNYQSDPRTICYMAPEQFIGKANEKSDQYALACLAYELIAGRMPFSAQGYAMMWANHYAEAPVPLSNLIPDLPGPIEKAVFKAMAKDPSERYADVSTFLLALENTALSPAPVITRRSSTISAFDPVSASVAEPLENMQSNAPIETSLAGVPVEGSLASAPFGMSLASAPFGTSLAGVPFGTSLVGVPFGTSLTGNPFEKSLTGNLFEKGLTGNLFEKGLAGDSPTTSLEGDSLEKSLTGNPFEKSLAEASLTTSLEGDSLGTGLAEASLGTGLAEVSLTTSLEGDSLGTGLEGNPFEMSLEGDLFGASLEEDLFGTGLEGNPFEMSLVDTPLTTHLLERWKQTPNKPDANKAVATGTPVGEAHIGLSWIRDFFQYCKYSIPALWFVRLCKSFTPGLWLVQLRGYLGNLLTAVRTGSRRGLSLLSEQPLITRLLEGWKRMSSERRANKAAATDTPAEEANSDITLHSDKQFSDGESRSQNRYAHMGMLPLNADWRIDIRQFSVGRFFQYRGYSIPALWFGQGHKRSTPALRFIVILSIIILIVGVISYAVLAAHPPSVTKSGKEHQNHQAIVNPRSVPIDTKLVTQPIAHSTMLPTQQENSPSSLSQPAQTFLTGNYAQQSQIYNLSTEGKLDWVDWGLNKPEDVNRRSGVQQQISTFSVISSQDNSIVQRASYNAGARLWWSDGTPIMTAQPQQASGIYVTGMSTGFSLSVPIGTTLRTLRVYVGVNGARGKFTASLNDKTYVDEGLSAAYDANGPLANGIYTLICKGSMSSQVLTVTYTAMTTNGGTGYVLLQAATLQ